MSNAPPPKALPPSAIAIGPSPGVWRLPPKQDVLKKGETKFDLHAVASNLTIVISTSIGEFTPSVDPVLAALESLQANLAFHWCRKLLVFDSVPSQADIQSLRRDQKRFSEIARGHKWLKLWVEKRSAYAEYCTTLKAMKAANHPALFNVELIFLHEFGHLFGTVKKAFQHISTPYVFMTQHDLRLAGRFVAKDVQRVLDVLSEDDFANYIILNRDVNSGSRTCHYFTKKDEVSTAGDGSPLDITLTQISGFSDQAHFARADWYRREVLDSIEALLGNEDQLTCMEHVLHEPWKEKHPDGLFLYGGTHDGPFVYDFVHGVQVMDEHGRIEALPSMPTRAAR